MLPCTGQGVVYRGTSLSYEFFGITTADKQMNLVLGTVHTRAIHGSENFTRRPDEELVFVLTGSIDIHFDTGKVMRMGHDDYFDSLIGYPYVSVSRKMIRVIELITSESNILKKVDTREANIGLCVDSNRQKIGHDQ